MIDRAFIFTLILAATLLPWAVAFVAALVGLCTKDWRPWP
jgi:hypothetical protein